MSGTWSCITSATWSRAIWASSPYLMRTVGSMLGDVVAPVPASSPPPRGSDRGELPCGVPVERALSRQRPGEVAEQRQSREGIDRLAGFVVIGHGAMLRRSGVRPTRRDRAVTASSPCRHGAVAVPSSWSRYRSVDDRRADRRRGRAGRPGDRRIAGPLQQRPARPPQRWHASRPRRQGHRRRGTAAGCTGRRLDRWLRRRRRPRQQRLRPARRPARERHRVRSRDPGHGRSSRCVAGRVRVVGHGLRSALQQSRAVDRGGHAAP